MDLKRALRWGRRCGSFGLAVALVLIALSFVADTTNLDVLYLILWPSSIGFMATENSTTFHRILIMFLLAGENGLLYFVVAFLLGLLPESERVHRD